MEYVQRFGKIDGHMNNHIAIGNPLNVDFYDPGVSHRGSHKKHGWENSRVMHNWRYDTSSDKGNRMNHLTVKCDHHIELVEAGRLGWVKGQKYAIEHGGRLPTLKEAQDFIS